MGRGRGLDSVEVLHLLEMSKSDEIITLAALRSLIDSAQAAVHTLEQHEQVVLIMDGATRDAQELLLQALRVLRNACATGGAEQLCELGLLPLIHSVVEAVAASAEQLLDRRLLHVSAQAVANACTASAACAASAWQQLFPRQLSALAGCSYGTCGWAGGWLLVGG
jgi:hypothetical protein